MGNLSVTVFHSGHPSHLLKLSDRPYRSQKTLTAGEFSGDIFRRSPFPTPTIPSGAQGGDLQVFSKHRRKNLSHALAMRVSLPATWISHAGAWGRVEHFPATASPSIFACVIRALKVHFLGFFVSVGPLNSLSGDLWWLPLHPKPCTCLGSVLLPFQ